MLRLHIPNSMTCAISLLELQYFILFLSYFVLFVVVQGRMTEKEEIGQVNMNKNMRTEREGRAAT